MSSWIGRIPHLIGPRRIPSKKWAFTPPFFAAATPDAGPARRAPRRAAGLLRRSCNRLRFGCPAPKPAAPTRRRQASSAAATGRVKFVNERLELTLEDGRLLKVAGLDPPRPTPDDPDLDAESGVKLSAWVVGKEIAFRLLETRPDRWGRLDAEVFAPAGDPSAPARPSRRR